MILLTVLLCVLSALGVSLAFIALQYQTEARKYKDKYNELFEETLRLNKELREYKKFYEQK